MLVLCALRIAPARSQQEINASSLRVEALQGMLVAGFCYFRTRSTAGRPRAVMIKQRCDRVCL